MELKENVKNVDEYNCLYDKVSWGARKTEDVSVALEHTLYSVSIYDNGKIIGYGRLIGDESIFLYIQDIMVDPDYQGKKVGTMIMNKLIDKIKVYQNKYESIRVYLGASKNKEEFYKKFGFITRDEADLGAGMILKN